MINYNPQKIEKKWQRIWEKKGINKTLNKSKKPKFYCLDMFPYPSGSGLHVGHPRSYTATDIISRFMKMKGYNVLHPTGWDAFGLPAENYAIKTGIHPEITTKKNIKRFKEQMKSLGLLYDWSREISTADPNYYKWTQSIFLLLFKMGLAYEAVLPINWCPSCKTGLANEEVIEGKCERCGEETTKKDLRQWVLKITAYAERLLEDLEGLDWPEKIITMQKNWIGKSVGVDLDFEVDGKNKKIKVFTTRPETLFGATFIVLSPEHPLVNEIIETDRMVEVQSYQNEAKKKSDLERTELVKDKTGVFSGAYAINLINDKKIPIWIADYVLISYGYGAVMAVPGHDQRDFDFAKKYNLPIIEVIEPKTETLINSGAFNGLASVKAKEEIVKYLEKRNLAKKATNYKLRDWVFSRQRYWGEPIPIIHCSKCGKVPVPEKDLPLKLPKVKKYQPTDTGESPLALIEKWVNTRCPKCRGKAKRETNTMPQWAGSCWYFLRFVDPKNKKALADSKKLKHWLPVDLYVGGAEHAVLHLLYSRFWLKVLYDAGVVTFKEPFLKLRNQGLILAADGQKMSKSKGNVVNPDDVIKEYGADALRLYEMFMGPFEDYISWDTKGIVGCSRFLHKVWNLQKKLKIKTQNEKVEKLIHQTLKKVTEDIENFSFNTAVSSLMILVNELEKEEALSVTSYQLLIQILGPFAPHISEELWFSLAKASTDKQSKKSIFNEKWPSYNPKLIKQELINLIIQINGKVRDKIETRIDISKELAEELALSQEKIKRWLQGKRVKKIIFVPGKLINLVV